MTGTDVDEAVVGVCVVRTECLPGDRRVTVTVTPDITGPAGVRQHPADVEEAWAIVARFLAEPCPPPRTTSASDEGEENP